jgi:hypothetical protein
LSIDPPNGKQPPRRLPAGGEDAGAVAGVTDRRAVDQVTN